MDKHYIDSFPEELMVTTLAILHIVVAIFLILLIMIQDPKGGGAGLFGGGGSNSVLGSSGATDFMTKLTRGTAVVFGVLCIAITLAIKPPKTGVFSKIPVPANEAPAATQPTDMVPVTPQPGEVAPAQEPAAKPEAK